MSNKNKNFVVNNIELPWFSADEISLKKLWEMAGRPTGKEPKQYFRITETAEFLCKLLEEVKGGQCPPLPKRPVSKGTDHAGRKWASTIAKLAKEIDQPIIRVKRGQCGGTFGHWKLALDYAGYLSPGLKSKFYEWIRERIEEETDPELAYSRGRNRAIKAWRNQGKSNDWIQDRINSIENYKQHTDVLASHGVGWQAQRNGFAECADAINSAILGGRSKKLKEVLGLTKKSQRLRDNLNRKQLTALSFAEALADDEIEVKNLQGNQACRQACAQAASKVTEAAQGSTRIINLII